MNVHDLSDAVTVKLLQGPEIVMRTMHNRQLFRE